MGFCVELLVFSVGESPISSFGPRCCGSVQSFQMDQVSPEEHREVSRRAGAAALGRGFQEALKLSPGRLMALFFALPH